MVFPRKRLSAPRWIVFVIDACFCMIALLISVIVTEDIHLGHDYGVSMRHLAVASVLIFSVRILSFIVFKTYSGIVRYTGMHDVMRIFFALAAGEVVLLGIKSLLWINDISASMPLLFMWVEFSILLCLMVISRMVFKLFFAKHFKESIPRCNVVIFGGYEYLQMVHHVLTTASDYHYDVKAFVDADHIATGRILSGIRVYTPEDLHRLLRRNDIDTLIIAQRLLGAEQKKKLIDICLRNGVTIKEIPNLGKLISGEVTTSQMRDVKIEDLLQREQIELDTEDIDRYLHGKVVLVTGAAGSIGSEIVRQLTRFAPAKIVLLDIAESPMYELELEMTEKLGFTNYVTELCSVRDREGLESVFARHQPQVVYHAAAYKHVPMIEKLPIEGVKTNVFGTKNVADTAVAFGSEKFVMISTDKAVNPTNVMGCTKRIAEIYIQSLGRTCDTAFITTRFGNVLGSTGSVIPRFRRQIEQGGPVTVTHPEITRFFMTIPEACQLVLQAGALGEGGEIFVFDMGQSVRIMDLARNMIRLSGYEQDKDIRIEITGLRPGEKLYEEVLNVQEEVLPTLCGRINRARVREYALDEVYRYMESFELSIARNDDFAMVKVMKELVPEYISQNSVFEQLDEPRPDTPAS